MIGTHNHKVGVVGLGNIFMDVLTEVDNNFLDKYGLEKGKLVSVNQVKVGFYEMIEDIKSAELVLGGGAANSIRIFQVSNQTLMLKNISGCAQDFLMETFQKITNQFSLALLAMINMDIQL